MRLIKAHIGLIKYIIQEFKKKKNLKGYVYFFGNLIKLYINFWIEYFKHLVNLFNSEYRKQLKQYKKYNSIKKDLQQALKILKYIDDKMQKAGLSRQKRRQFWNDFYKNGQVRKEMFDELMKEMK